MLPTHSSFPFTPRINEPASSAGATRPATETTPAASGSSIRGAFAGIAASFQTTPMVHQRVTYTMHKLLEDITARLLLAPEEETAIPAGDSIDEVLSPPGSPIDGLSVRRVDDLSDCDNEIDRKSTNATLSTASKLTGCDPAGIAEEETSNSLVRSTALDISHSNSVSAASVLGSSYDLDDYSNEALASGNRETSLMLTAVAHNRPFGPERPLIITDFSHNAVFHPEFPLNRGINLPLQALNALLAQQEETPNSLVRSTALDISHSNSVSAASVLGSAYDFDLDAFNDDPKEALAPGNREAPSILKELTHDDPLITTDSQPRSLAQNLAAAVMLSSAVAAATYIKNPEEAKLVLRQAGLALTTLAKRAMPLIWAGWESLAQGASVRWGQLVPQVRTLIGAGLESGQATLSRIAQRGMPVIGSGFRQARSGLTTLGNQGIVWIGSGLQAQSGLRIHTKK